jgi:hypothetical protein
MMVWDSRFGPSFIGREPGTGIGRFTGINTVAKKTRKAGKAQPDSQRKVIVFASLLAVMTATSALLLALAPAPLAPGAVRSLALVGQSQSLDAVFDTPVPVRDGRWQYVFIHHSRTDGGDAATLGEQAGGLADHFVIGNGDGCGDGEVQVAQRWHRQAAAGRLPGLKSIDPACVSICLVGDFERAKPTAVQVKRLSQLVAALQARCGIPAGNVHLFPGDATVTGVGRFFPLEAVREQLLP